jgi:hypothetical protein
VTNHDLELIFQALLEPRAPQRYQILGEQKNLAYKMVYQKYLGHDDFEESIFNLRD